VTDNYFTSMKLIVDLVVLGTYACRMVVSNQVRLPKVMANKQAFAREPQGTVTWQIHINNKLSCMLWVDKKPVFLLPSFFIN